MAKTTNDLIIIGFDTEYVLDPETNSNRVLSYQYAGITGKGRWSGILFPEGLDKSDRWIMGSFIGRALEHGRKEKAIGRKWPETVYAAAHFSRADLPSFKDFSEIQRHVDSLRKTFATLTEPYTTHFNDASRNRHDLNIYLIDTMLLTPDGAGLGVLGGLYGLPKIELPSGMIKQMDKLLETDPDLFRQYAIRDAEIAARHAWNMTQFAQNNMGTKKPPTTLGSLAVDYIQAIWDQNGIDSAEVLGHEMVYQTRWDSKNNRSRKIKSAVRLSQVNDHLNLATECYHGGRNEAYVFGFTEMGLWADYDLRGAYTTAMSAIRIPDYSSIRLTTDVNDFKADQLGLAKVRFKFPADILFPCLPVRHDHGLVFPLEGETYVGSPEIELALQMGAELEIEHGIVVPWKSDVRPFELFSKSILEKRSQHRKGSVEEQTWKEIGNSLYGKMAQGLDEKRVYDNRSDKAKKLAPSPVTQAYLAAYTTSLVRAVLGEILHRIPRHRTVVSATTDGFLTNARSEELDLTGPLCRLYSDLRFRLSGNPEILEVKHRALQVLCWKTRGQASIDFTGQGMTPINAKAGIKVPEEVVEEVFRNWDHPYDALPPDDLDEKAQSEWIVKLFLDRDAETTITQSDFVSVREMVKQGMDLVQKETIRRVNLEYDWKRELIDAQETQALGPVPSTGSERYHLFALSRPWKTVTDFETVRQQFDIWHTKRQGVLKTLADWNAWNEFRLLRQASEKGVRAGKGGPLGQAQSIFLKAYTRGIWGLPGVNYRTTAEALTNKGYQTTEDDLKNAKRSKVEPAEHALPATEEVRGFIKAMTELFPNFEGHRMITTDMGIPA